MPRSSGGVEADPGLGGQAGDPLRPQHRRELAQHAWQPSGCHHRHPSATTLPHGTWVPWTARIGTTTTSVRSGPGRPGRPRTTLPVGPGRAGNGHATAAQIGRAGGDRDTAWSRSRIPRPGRSPSDRGWPGYRGRPGRAGPPTPAAPAQPRRGRCVAPPPLPAARRRPLGWAGTAASSRLPWPRARRGPVQAGAPPGCRGLRRRPPPQGWRPPARAGCGSRPPTRPPVAAATAPGPSRLTGQRWSAPAALPPADQHRYRPAVGRGRW
jgi:hypothetical protein